MLRRASACAGSGRALRRSQSRAASLAAAASAQSTGSQGQPGEGPTPALQRSRRRRLTSHNGSGSGSGAPQAGDGTQDSPQITQPTRQQGFLGTQLLQQPQRPPPGRLSLGTALLQQAPVTRQQQQQQQQHTQPQPEHHQQQQQQAPEQPQLSSRAVQPRPPQALTAADGFLLSRRQAYMTPEAVEPQQHWSPPDLQQLEARVAAMPPEQLAAEVKRAAAAAAKVVRAGLLQPAAGGEGGGYTGSNPRLFFALQALVAERQAVAEPQLEAAADASTAPVRRSSRELDSPASVEGHTGQYTITTNYDCSTPSYQLVQQPSSSSSSSSSSKGRASPGAAGAPSPGARRRSSSSSTAAQQPGRHSGSAAASMTAGPVASAAVQVGPEQPVHSSSRASSSSSSARQQGSEASGAPGPSSSEVWQSDELVLARVQQCLQDHGFPHLPHLRFGKQRPLCPQCEGGSSGEQSLSLWVREDGRTSWLCFIATCSWRGSFRLPGLRGRRSSSSSGDEDVGGGSRGRGVTGSSAGQLVPLPVAAHVAAHVV